MPSRLIQDLQEELAEIKAQLKDLRDAGQSNSLVGSHDFTGVDYSVLLRQKRDLESRIMSLNGGKNTNTARYS